MRSLLYILMAFALTGLYSCGKQQTVANTNKTDNAFDFSLFYNVNSSDEYIRVYIN